ncbi:hypothetical protein [Cryobacterium gelidum]|uniref:Uncharacterized protein n=1 Tax=Cryobacterium gelidum TaxID=1259164 RepID=A0A4R9AR25_9MICO|nr:hypothetical protein [Cryobacterium gelidum]TFD67355.1 hypothetical protein E3T50_15185 [Cryobacterium gelidum]
MSQRNTLVRSLHDIGLAAWFGGSVMGAVGLNGAAATVKDPKERIPVATAGWKGGAPVQLAAFVAHGVGDAGLILGNEARLAGQPEARANTAVKLALTFTAVSSSVYSGFLGAQMAAHAGRRAQGVTGPSSASSSELASAQAQQQRPLASWMKRTSQSQPPRSSRRFG